MINLPGLGLGDRAGSGLTDHDGLFEPITIPRVKLPPKKRGARKRKRSSSEDPLKLLRLATGNVMRSRSLQQQEATVEQCPLVSVVTAESLLLTTDEAPVINLPTMSPVINLPAATAIVNIPAPTPIEEEVDITDIANHLPIDCYEQPLEDWDPVDVTSSYGLNAGNTFVNLPGEILNLIVEFVFSAEDTYEIKWRHGKSLQTHWKHLQKREGLDRHTNYGFEYYAVDTSNPLYPGSYNWRRGYEWSPTFTTLFESPVMHDSGTVERRLAFRPGFRRYKNPVIKYVAGATAFLMVCHRFHDIGVSRFYGQTKFSFGSVELCSKFIKNLLPMTLPWLKTLFLCHEVYGHPKWTSMLPVRERDERKWEDTCWRAATTLTGLQNIYLLVRLKESPPDVSMQAPWLNAILPFKETKLANFDLALRSGLDATDTTCEELTACRKRVRAIVLQHLPSLKSEPGAEVKW